MNLFETRHLGDCAEFVRHVLKADPDKRWTAEDLAELPNAKAARYAAEQIEAACEDLAAHVIATKSFGGWSYVVGSE